MIATAYSPTLVFAGEADKVSLRGQVLRAMVAWQEAHPELVTPRPPEQIPVPEEVPMWALKEVCLVRGHGPAIEAALNSLPDPPRTIARNRWENKDTISRGSSIISAMQAMLGWSSAYVDDLFRAAAAL